MKTLQLLRYGRAGFALVLGLISVARASGGVSISAPASVQAGVPYYVDVSSDPPVYSGIILLKDGQVVASDGHTFSYYSPGDAGPQTIEYVAFSVQQGYNADDAFVQILATNNPPQMAFDWVSDATNGGLISGGGWAADPEHGTPVDRVEIFVTGASPHQATLGGDRPDVANAFGRSDYRYSGFGFSIPVPTRWLIGNNPITARAYDAQGNFTSKNRTVVIVNSDPTGSLQILNASKQTIALNSAGRAPLPFNAQFYVRVNAADVDAGDADLSRLYSRVRRADGSVCSDQDIAVSGGSAYLDFGPYTANQAGVWDIWGRAQDKKSLAWGSVSPWDGNSHGWATFNGPDIEVAKGNQATLTLNGATPQTFNTSQTLGSSGGSGGGAVSYAIVNQSPSGAATLSGATLTANVGTGWVDLRATKAADSNYHAKDSATVRVNFQKGEQATLNLTRSTPQTYTTSQTLGSSGGSGGGSVSYAIVAQSAGGAATLSGSTLTANVGTGWVDVQATKAADSNYNAKVSATVRVSFQKAGQTTLNLTRSTPQTHATSQTLGSGGGSGGGAVSYVIVGESTSGAATLSGSTLTANVGTGWVDVQTTKAADSNYNATASATARVTFQKAEQAPLNLVRSTPQTRGASQTLGTSGGSGGGSVSYAIVAQSASGAATLSGSTLTANVGTGWVDLRATKAADSNYHAKDSATVRVNFQKGEQATLNLTRSTPQTYTTSQTLGSSGGSGGGSVSYAIVAQSAGGAATLSGSTLAAHTGTGWADVQATKAGDGNYNAATSVPTRVTFQKAGQAAVSLSASSSQTYGTSQTLGASGGSGGGAFSYAIVGQSAIGVATLSGSTLTATAGTGWVDVQATKAADGNFDSKASSTVRVSLAKAGQPALAVARSATQAYATSQTLSSSGGGGGGAVSYAIVDQSAGGVATLSGSTLTANAGAGWVDVQATKAGDANYNAITSATARVAFQKAGQAALSVIRSSPQTYGTSQTLSSSGGSGGGAVTYAIVDQSAGGVATLSGATLTANAPTGWVDVQATKASDVNYNAKASSSTRVTFQYELVPPESVVYVSETFCRIEWSHNPDSPRIARYEVRFDGAISSVPLNASQESLYKQFDQLAKGSTHTVAVRAIDAVGIASAWSETRTITTYSFTDGRGVAEVVVTPKVVTNGESVTIAVVMADLSLGGYINGSLKLWVQSPRGSSPGGSYTYLQFPASLEGQDPNFSLSNPSVHKFVYTPQYDGEYHASAVLHVATKYPVSEPRDGMGPPVEFPNISGYPDTFVFNDLIPAPPTVPTGLEISWAGTKAFSVKWKEPYDADGVEGYEARIVGQDPVDSGNLSATFNYLEVATEYSVQVRARDTKGNWSAWSSSISVTTASYPASDIDGDGIPNELDAQPSDASNALAASPGDPNRSQFDAYYYSQFQSAFRVADAAKKTRWTFSVSGAGTGTVTITAAGKAGIYSLENGVSHTFYDDEHPGLELREGETASVQVSSVGVSDYTILLRPYLNPRNGAAPTRALYNDQPGDGIKKSDITNGAFQVGIDVTAKAPFAILGTSDLENRRLLKLGLGYDFRGRSSGYLAVDLGPYGFEFDNRLRNQTSIDIVAGIGTDSLAVGNVIQAKSPSGWLDARLSNSGARLDVRFYPSDSIVLGTSPRDFGTNDPVAHYRLDLAETGLPPPGPITGVLHKQRLRIQQTIEGVARVMEVTAQRQGNRFESESRADPTGNSTWHTSDTLTTHTNHFPWRKPLAARNQQIQYLYSHSAGRHENGQYELDVSGNPFFGRYVWEPDGGVMKLVSEARWTFPKSDRYLDGQPYSNYRSVGLDRQFVSSWTNAEMNGVWDYNIRTNEFETTKDGGLIFRERYRPKLSRVVGWDSGWPVAGVVDPGNMDDQNELAEGKVREERRSFLDSDQLGGGTDIVTRYTYHPVMYDKKVRVKREKTTQGGETIGIVEYEYPASSDFNTYKTLKTNRTDYASASDPGMITTTLSYSASSDVTDDLRERPISVQRPDGTKTSYAYQRGTLNLATGDWTASASGNHFLIAELGGRYYDETVGGSDPNRLLGHAVSSFAPKGGSPIEVDPLDMQVGRSTISEQVVNNCGNVVREATYVVTSSSTVAQVAATYHSYDDFGHLRKSADGPSGQSPVTLYEATYEGLFKKTETDAQGIVTKYQSDGYGRVQIVEKEGFELAGHAAQPAIKTYFLYDGANRVKERIDGYGVAGSQMTTLFEYDTQGRVILRKDPGVAEPTLFDYDDPEHPRATVVTLPTGGTQIASRYRDGKPKSIAGSGAVGESYSYIYQSGGQLKTTRSFPDEDLSADLSTSTYSDWLGRTVGTEEPVFSGGQRVTLSVYNAKGQLAHVEVRDGANGPHLLPRSQYEYDDYGRILRTGSNSFDSDYGTVEALGLLTDTNIIEYESEISEEGAGKWYLVERQFDYPYPGESDRRRLLERLTQLGGFDEGRIGKVVEHDAFGNKTTSITVVDRAARKATTTTEILGGGATKIGVDAVSISINGLVVSSTSVQGHTTTYAYDDVGRLWTETDPRIGATTYAYKPNSSLLQSVTASDGVETYHSYDAYGRLAWRRVSAPGSGEMAQYQLYNYDFLGNVTETWGNSVYPVRYTFDGLGRRKTMRTYRAEAGWTEPAFKPAAFDDGAQGDVTTWNYDPRTGLLVSKKDAADKGAMYGYDALGRVKSRTDARGVETKYEYCGADKAGEGAFTGALRKVDYPDVPVIDGGATVPVTADVIYSYHRNGGYKTIEDAMGERVFSYYDAPAASPSQASSGLMSQETLGSEYASRAILRTYHFGDADQANGARDKFTYQAQNYTYSVEYDFSDEGRLSAVAPDNDPARPFKYTYLANSNLVSHIDRDRGASRYYRESHYEPDSNRLSRFIYRYGSPLAWKGAVRAEYDSLGRKTEEKRRGETAELLGFHRDGYGALHVYNSENLPIDPAPAIDRNELIASEKFLLHGGSDSSLQWNLSTTPLPQSARGYQHDAIGNRTLADESFTPNQLNQYTMVGGSSLSYDDNGNLLRDSMRSYVYDAENRLVEVEVLSGPSAGVYRYAYDYLGRRAKKQKSGDAATLYVYDGWNLIAETDASANVAKRYYWGLDASGTLEGAGGVGGLLKMVLHDEDRWLHPIYDTSSNVIGMRLGNGELVAAYDYDPFGVETGRAGSYADDNPFRFSTKYTDEETGLVYYGMRFYSPELGRFVNRDPIGEAGGLNLYGFVGNDPANGYDYLGMKGWWGYLFGSKGSNLGVAGEANRQARQDADRQHGSVFDALRSGTYLSWSNTYQNSYQYYREDITYDYVTSIDDDGTIHGYTYNGPRIMLGEGIEKANELDRDRREEGGDRFHSDSPFLASNDRGPGSSAPKNWNNGSGWSFAEIIGKDQLKKLDKHGRTLKKYKWNQYMKELTASRLDNLESARFVRSLSRDMANQMMSVAGKIGSQMAGEMFIVLPMRLRGSAGDPFTWIAVDLATALPSIITQHVSLHTQAAGYQMMLDNGMFTDGPHLQLFNIGEEIYNNGKRLAVVSGELTKLSL